MPDFPNVYENLGEAQRRLQQTIVMYEGAPVYVLAITNHKPDGIFRMYLEPITLDDKPPVRPQILGNISTYEDPRIGPEFDKWLETDEGKASGVTRKRIDSKHFNRFRPFPLGMCNYGTNTYYIEWSPFRSTHQGLTSNSIVEELVSSDVKSQVQRSVPTSSPGFYECIKASHPSASECLEALKDPTTENTAHAFHRRFALVRGPIDMLFLAYKSDIIGVMPKLDFSMVRLGRNFSYCKEVVAELGLFDTIVL